MHNFLVKVLEVNLRIVYVEYNVSNQNLFFTGDQMFNPFWESVSRLERCGFKVMGLTCDGLSANRLLYKLHVPKGKKLVNSVTNPYASPSRPLFFFSDPPHLMKTVRNAWANYKRKLEVKK